ncbi:hypothetical protein QYM36_008495 [Artemia franciscana]|uniref:Uncharacterized protein n=1 Tax=Artemia franciscana TaxID=6661 RepID=A0AA88LLL6_ARTSF|nr:hypothetical protein QYM36_008495 [Artemia franciscana]
MWYDYAKADYDGFKKFTIDLNLCNEFRKPGLSLDMISNILFNVISRTLKFVPKINFCPRLKNRVTLSKPVLKAIKGKNAAWRGFIADRTDVNIETYKKARNHVTKLLHENRRELKSILIRNPEQNPKGFWRYVGRFSGDKSPSSIIFREGTILIKMDVCKTEKFKYVFSCSFGVSGTDSSTKNELESSIRNDLTSLNGVPDDRLFSISKVLKVQRTLNTGESPDIDGITNIMLNNLASVLCEPFVILFNRLFSA